MIVCTDNFFSFLQNWDTFKKKKTEKKRKDIILDESMRQMWLCGLRLPPFLVSLSNSQTTTNSLKHHFSPSFLLKIRGKKKTPLN